MKICSFSVILKGMPIKTIKTIHILLTDWWPLQRLTVTSGGAMGFAETLAKGIIDFVEGNSMCYH